MASIGDNDYCQETSDTMQLLNVDVTDQPDQHQELQCFVEQTPKEIIPLPEGKKFHAFLSHNSEESERQFTLEVMDIGGWKRMM